MTASPLYDCQSALQVKLQAVLKARCHERFGKPFGFSGSHCCVIRIASSDTNPTDVKITTAHRYVSHDVSSAGSTPVSL